MKILFVLEHYYPYLGGAEKLFQQVAEAFAEDGHQVTIVTTLFKRELPKQEMINGVKIHRLACQSRFLFTFLSMPLVWKHASSTDLLITTTYNAALPSWIIGKLRRKKTILVFHEYWGKLWFSLPYLNLFQQTMFFAYEWLIIHLPFYQYIAVSKSTQQRLIGVGVPRKRISQIYNGIDYNSFRSYPWAPQGDFTLLYYGRLGISKGLNLLLPAWKAFKELGYTGQLQLVIPKYPQLLYREVCDMIRKLNFSGGDVQLFHELEEHILFTQVSKAHAVIIPSYSEGFCFVAVETMAIGTPIISSGKGSLKEVVNGTFIEIRELTTEGILEALEKSIKGDWLHTPNQLFPLEEARKKYIQLISQI
ncbi:glycosyltransferase family 4 protein [Lewinella sp. LCG006]|uniref:glycosyltransferase family 4 protein n=1 Tax=Lewinella sp. LCG006 TaxID=3231911 RepID=UPI00346101AA